MKHVFLPLLAVLFAACPAAAEPESVFFDEESEVTALVERGDAALKKGDWEGAIDAWQTVLNDYPASVLPAEDGIWLPASVVCSRKIAALPAEAIKAYEQRYETPAAQKLAQGTPAGLRSAAEQFFCTRSGGEAMERLGNLYADQGAVALAVRCWEAVAGSHPTWKGSPAMLARLGLACVRLGLAERARDIVARHGDRTLLWRGAESTIGAIVNAAIAAPPPPQRTGVFLPDLTFAPVPDAAPEPRSVKWRLELGPRNDAPEVPDRWIRRGGGAGSLQTYPSVAAGKLFVNLGRCLIALDSATGEFQWRIGEPLGEVAAGGPFKLPAGFFQGVTPAFWGHRWFAVISDGVLYANLTKTGKWCQLRAIRVSDARLVWGPEMGIVADFDLTGPPLVWRDRVYVGGVPREDAKRGEVWLFAFDRRTGALEWKTFISSYQPQGNRWGAAAEMPVFAPVVTASGSYVYVCTNNGALACVGHTGQVVWATKYPRPNDYNPFGWLSQTSGDTWDLSPIFTIGRDLIFLPSDGSHCCRLDSITGRGHLAPRDPNERVSNPLQAMKIVKREDCRHLVAVDGDLGTLVGPESKVYDLKLAKFGKIGGEAAYVTVKTPFRYCGRALVTKNEIFVPVRGSSSSAIRIFDRAFRNSRDVKWPAAGPPGTLMLAGKLLLSVSPHEIVALSDEAPPNPPDDGTKPPGDGTEPPMDGAEPPDDDFKPGERGGVRPRPPVPPDPEEDAAPR